jgi:hypothetical protein
MNSTRLNWRCFRSLWQRRDVKHEILMDWFNRMGNREAQSSTDRRDSRSK